MPLSARSYSVFYIVPIFSVYVLLKWALTPYSKPYCCWVVNINCFSLEVWQTLTVALHISVPSFSCAPDWCIFPRFPCKWQGHLANGRQARMIWNFLGSCSFPTPWGPPQQLHHHVGSCHLLAWNTHSALAQERSELGWDLRYLEACLYRTEAPAD